MYTTLRLLCATLEQHISRIRKALLCTRGGGFIQSALCRTGSGDHVNLKKSWWYKMVARDEKSMMKLVRFPILSPLLLKREIL